MGKMLDFFVLNQSNNSGSWCSIQDSTMSDSCFSFNLLFSYSVIRWLIPQVWLLGPVLVQYPSFLHLSHNFLEQHHSAEEW